MNIFLILFLMAIAVLAQWLFLFVVFVGVGLLCSRLFGLRTKGVQDLPGLFWIGWGYTIFFLQLWHLIFPVNVFAFAVVSLIGMGGMVWNKTVLQAGDDTKVSVDRIPRILFSTVFILTTLLIANRAILPPLNYDTGLYHLNSLRWDATFPIVPGLGNLHGRLAFNCSYFLYAAILEIGFWVRKSFHLANGLLLLVCIAEILNCWFQVFTKKQRVFLRDIFGALAIFPLFIIPDLGTNISSLSPDLSINLLALVLTRRLLWFVESSAKERAYHFFLIVTLVMLGIVIKLSFVVFGILVLFFALIHLRMIKQRDDKEDFGTFRWILICFSIAVVPWMIRGVILSGYVAYPFAFGPFPVEWRIPHASVVNMANWIYAWARMPQAHHWSEVSGRWDWFLPWLTNKFSNPSLIAWPSSLSIIGLGMVLWLCIFKIYKPVFKECLWLFPFFLILTITHWFFVVPDFRFGCIFFWLLGISVLALALGCFPNVKQIVQIFLITTFAALVVINFRTGGSLSRDWIIWPYSQEGGFYPPPKTPLKEYTTRSGLVIYTPAVGDQLWDAALPCSPYVHPDLRLRKENMRYGFVINKKSDNDASVGMHEEWIREKWVP